jgi:HEAT repeat protein
MSIQSQILRKVFDIQPDEYRVFGWTAGLMFLVLFSQILFANFADTAFIKRFGVEYLPEMFVIDAIVVFFAMDLVRGLANRYSPFTLLSRIFVIFAGIEILCRFLVLLDFSLLYPIMFILRQQFDGVILIIFWNICNDIFDTRQSKRIFPLITAGGILGRVLGSFSTHTLAQMTTLDNLLVASAGILLLGAVANQRLGRLNPAPVGAPRIKPSGEKKGWSSPIAGIKEMSLLAKGSLLFGLLAAIRILPNIVAPMFDFQFSVILAETFPSETELAQFYGVFRGALNIITFVVLLFIGKVHTKVGIPNALLFRPGNFFFVFSLLLFRFDILVGIYGRISISVFTSTLHNPANNILVNLFPDDMRAKIRPILQMASRMGSLLGSVILVALKAFLHASLFSIFGIVFSGVWILVTWRLKRKYSSFVLESLIEKQVDLADLQEMDLRVLVHDQATRDRLLQSLRDEKGQAAVLCARILSEAEYPKLGEAILSVIQEKDVPTKVALFDLLPAERARPLVPRLVAMAETASPRLRLHLVRAVARLDPGENVPFLVRMSESDDRRVQAEAIVGLYRTEAAPKAYCLLSEALDDSNTGNRLVAIRTVARVGEMRLVDRLGPILEGGDDPGLRAAALDALGRLGAENRNPRVVPWLKSPDSEVRRAAVSALSLDNDHTLGQAIQMLGDEAPDVRQAAMERIVELDKAAVPLLFSALTSPKRALKDGILQILQRLEVKDVAFSDFIEQEIRHAYENLRAAEIIRTLQKTPSRGLLLQHLEDNTGDAIFTVFRILEVQGDATDMRRIYRGLQGAAREKANALEALEQKVHARLTRLLVPLVEKIPVEEKLKIGRKRLGIDGGKPARPQDVLAELVESHDSTTQICALAVIRGGHMEGLSEKVMGLQDHPDTSVSAEARLVLETFRTPDPSSREKTHLAVTDKMVWLQGIEIFSGLQVRELEAISSTVTERAVSQGEIVIKQGEPGDTMFLIASGEFSVLQDQGTTQERLINTITTGDYFGEMALFEGKPRLFTVRAQADGTLLVLGKQEFQEVMRNFPQIPINIGRVLSHRIRTLDHRLVA